MGSPTARAAGTTPGTGGRVRTAGLYAFTGNYPGDWSWLAIGNVSFALGSKRLEVSTPTNLSASGSKYYVEIGNSLGSADTSTPGGDATRGAPGTSATSFSVAPTPVPMSPPHSSSPAQTRGNTLIDPNSNAVSTQYNHQRKVVRAGDTPGGPCDATNSDGCWYSVFSDQLAEETSNTTASTETITTGGKVLRVDAASSASFTGNGAAISFSWSHAGAPSPTNYLAVVGVSFQLGASVAPSSVTFGSSAMTVVGTQFVSDQGIRIYKLINPPTGTQTVQVTFGSPPTTSGGAVGGAITYTGADQTNGVRNFLGASGSSANPTVTITSASGNIVQDCIEGDSGFPSLTATGTQQWNRIFRTSNHGASQTKQGAASVTMDWTVTASDNWAIGGVDVIASGAFPTDIQSQNGVYIEYRENMEALLGYRSNTGTSTTSSLKTRSLDTYGLAAEAEQATAGSPLRAVRMAWSPTSPATRIIVTQSDDGFLDAYVCTPSCTVTNNIDQVWSAAPSTPQKRFDVAYEQLSGEALLVYGVLSTSTTCDIAYKTYISGTWSAQNCLDDTGHAADIQYAEIDLAPKKGSDQIGLIGADVTDNDANAWIWDGSAWGSNNEITAAMKAPSEEEVAIAWESSSGSLLAGAVDRATQANVVFQEYTTGWSGTLTTTCGAAGASIR